MRSSLICTLLSAGFLACASPHARLLLPRDAVVDNNAARLFAAHQVEGAFVLLHAPTQRLWVVNPQVAQERYTPASTFKIPNALIGLSTGVIAEADPLKWDGTRHTFVKAWNRDHNLRSAIRYSVVWYFQELARRVGPQRMQSAIDAMSYGNRDLSGGVDRFWLDGALRISPYEQVRFVEKLWATALPFPAEQQVRVRELLVEYERSGTHVWRGKTGTALRAHNSNRPVLWLVGGVESPAGPWLYAMLVRAPRSDLKRVMGPLRIELARSLLERGGALPPKR